jgi:MFS family permease
VALVDLIGFGLIIPLIPIYAPRLGASEVQLGLLLSLYPGMQLIFTPLLGRLSDRIGRRPVLLVGMIGGAIFYAMISVADVLGSLTLLFVSRGVHGVIAGNIAAAQAYIADVTTPGERAKGMGLFGAVFGLAFVLGPALGAGLAALGDSITPGYGSAWPPLGAAAASLVAACLVAFKLSESVQRGNDRHERRRAMDLRRLLLVLRDGVLTRLLVLWTGLMLAWAFLESTFVFMCKDLLGFELEGAGLIMAYIGLLMVLVQGLLIAPLTRRFGEPRLATSGPALSAAGFLATAGMAHWGVFSGPWGLPVLLGLCPVIALGGGLWQPSMTSLISRRAKSDNQGGVLGLSQSLSSFSRTIIFTVGMSIYALDPAWPYCVGGLLLAAAAVFAWSLQRVHDRWLPGHRADAADLRSPRHT